MDNHDKIIKKLNTILEKNYDAEKGYQTAAENVDHFELKRYFEARSQERKQFIKSLEKEINVLGGGVERGTSLTADAHRVWMNLKSSLSSNDENAILTETVRGEENALKEYEELLDDVLLPESTSKLILKQRSSILNALEDAKSFQSISA